METKPKHNKTERKKSLELFVVIMLGITAVLSAWASWIGGLHADNRVTKYALSNNLAVKGNSEYNNGMQLMGRDILIWDNISDLQVEIYFARQAKDTDRLHELGEMLFYKLKNDLNDNMANAVGWSKGVYGEGAADPTSAVLSWMDMAGGYVESPFLDMGYISSYTDSGGELLEQSARALAEGQESDRISGKYGMVTVVYSLVLFLLGIDGSVKGFAFRRAVTVVAVADFIAATVYMLLLPLPEGFSVTALFAA